MVAAQRLHLALLVVVFVLGQEVGELFVVLQLGLLHRHNLLDVHLEVLQVVHEHLLLLLELVDVFIVVGETALAHIKLRNRNVSLIILEHIVSGRWLERLKGGLHGLVLRSDEHLHFGRPAQDRMLRELQQELRKVMLTLLNEELVHLTLRLLGRNRRNEQTGITLRQVHVEDVEFAVPAPDVDGTEAVVTLDPVLRVLRVPGALGLARDNLEIHVAIIAHDAADVDIAHLCDDWILVRHASGCALLVSRAGPGLLGLTSTS